MSMKVLEKNKKLIIILGAVIIICCLLALASRMFSREEEIKEYAYTAKEQALADKVKIYLQENVELSENAVAEIANEAVENYRLILNSNIDTVNDDHTQAIQAKIRTSMENTEELTDQDINGLSAGVAALVWETILEQIEANAEGTDPGLEYYSLTESLQAQIKALEERKMKVSIQANIKDNLMSEMSAEELLALVNGMTDQELEELAAALGINYDDLKKLIDSLNSDINKELDSKLEELKKELSKELSDELAKELPSDGKNGKDGKNGTDGKSITGKQGATGAKGNSVYIRYSANSDGKDMTTEPNQNTRYMGTYTGAEASTRPSDYSWSQYRGNDGNSIFIMYSANPDGTDMKSVPDDSTKYMGTYTGKDASDDPSDYVWTRYSDATISYSDGTLYIIQ